MGQAVLKLTPAQRRTLGRRRNAVFSELYHGSLRPIRAGEPLPDDTDFFDYPATPQPAQAQYSYYQALDNGYYAPPVAPPLSLAPPPLALPPPPPFPQALPPVPYLLPEMDRRVSIQAAQDQLTE
ncbi:uncharacterized protein LOC144102460 [Amblyomma americanum]